MKSYVYRNKKVSKKSSSFTRFKDLIKSSWWVVAFCLFTYMLANQSFSLKKGKLQELEQQYLSLEAKRQEAMMQKERLLVHLDSHADPEFISMVLKKKLGVVPEGQIKVHFKKDGSGIQSYFDEL
ncbi:MAG: hypothetical protein S4CHLAM37_06010 [Chlamydiia bacterium]|nr:hypothetical protein [Chlamydiia bacterium]